jgi:hypothetical protein
MLPKLPNIGNLGRKIDSLLLPGIVILVGLGAFGLGRLSAPSHEPVALKIIYPEAQAAAAVQAAPPSSVKAVGEPGGGGGLYVASKSGTKYYLTSCSGASRIKEENRVYFDSAAQAAAAGYGPAANCPGI